MSAISSKNCKKTFKQEAAEKVSMLCDAAIESEENYNETFKEFHECVNNYNKLLKECENIKSMREEKEFRRNRLQHWFWRGCVL